MAGFIHRVLRGSPSVSTSCAGGGDTGSGPASFSNTKSVLFTASNTEYATKTNPSAAIGSGITTLLTVTFWAKISANSNVVYPAVGQFNSNIANGQKWWLGFLQAGGLRFTTSQNGTNNAAADYTGASYNDGTWRHFALTYNGGGGAGGIVFYVNGNSVHSATPAHTSLYNTSFDFRIGSAIGSTGTNFTFDGNLDEVGIFNAALSASEISEIYNSGSPADLSSHSKAANLVGWWRMGDGDTYPTLQDEINSNDLTMVNMVAGDIVTDTP